MSLRITSLAFPPNGKIPPRYTCDGEDLSPPLAWRGVPAEAASLALIVDDPDAPDPAAPRTIWTHWLLYDLPPDNVGLPEGVRRLPPGTREGLNDWQRTGYGGPCPPVGRHRYFFRLFALDVLLSDLNLPGRDELLAALRGHVLDEAELVGLYQRR